MEQVEYRHIEEKVYFYRCYFNWQAYKIMVDTMLDATLYVPSALCPQQD